MNHRIYRAFDGPVALMAAASLLGLLAAYERRAALPALAWLGGGMMLYGLASRLTPKGRETAARLAVFLSAAVSLFFISQAGRYGGEDKLAVITNLLARLEGWLPDVRAWEPYPNSVATFLEGLFLLGIGLALRPRTGGAGWRGLIWAVVGLTGLGLVASQSRGAWLGVAAAGLVWLALRYRLARWLAAAGAAAVLVLALVILVGGDVSVIERIPVAGRLLGAVFLRPDRLEVYRGGWQLIRELPISGTGFGPQFAMNYSKFVLLIQVPYLTYSHNFYLETWLQMGLVGVLAVLWLTGLVAAVGVRLAGKNKLAAEAIWAGTVALLVHGLSDARMFVDGWCWPPFFLLLGLLAGEQATGGGIQRSDLRRYALPVIAGLLVVVVGLALLPGTAAAWWANQGSLKQARAELAPGLSEATRQGLRTIGEADFRRALARKPDGRAANLRLGLLLSSQNRHDEAVPVLQAALRVEPLNFTTRKALGLAYVWVGRVTEATDLLRDIPAITQELNTWGWYRDQNGEPVLARWAYQASLNIDPNQTEVRGLLETSE